MQVAILGHDVHKTSHMHPFYQFQNLLCCAVQTIFHGNLLRQILNLIHFTENIWEFFMDFVYHSAWKQLLFVPISAIPCLTLTLIWVGRIDPDMLEIKSNINWLTGPLACTSSNTAKNDSTLAKVRESLTTWAERIIINSLFGAFIDKCMFLGSFKHNLNIKGGKGSGKRKRGNVSLVWKKTSNS